MQRYANVSMSEWIKHRNSLNRKPGKRGRCKDLFVMDRPCSKACYAIDFQLSHAQVRVLIKAYGV